MQSKRQSITEALFNVMVGYWINVGVQLIVYPIYGATFSFAQNIEIGLIFLVVALVRSYAFRRYFNWKHHHENLNRRAAG